MTFDLFVTRRGWEIRDKFLTQSHSASRLKPQPPHSVVDQCRSRRARSEFQRPALASVVSG
jgi:hypothetical protein